MVTQTETKEAATEERERGGWLEGFFQTSISIDLSLLIWLIFLGLSLFALATTTELRFSTKDLIIYVAEIIISLTVFPYRMDGYRFNRESPFGWSDRKDRWRQIAQLVVAVGIPILIVLLQLSKITLITVAETVVIAFAEQIFFGLWFPSMIIFGFRKASRLFDWPKFNRTPVVLLIGALILSDLTFAGLHGHKYSGGALWWVVFMGLALHSLTYYFPGIGVGAHFCNNLLFF